ncbi:MAG TPA: T9SS type A sorting domain-containing protein, partial [Melioribacteraceae bacterium]|nr:T9SS type A sorting domain-containing protein [Melioribacteraceae bacterium]
AKLGKGYWIKYPNSAVINICGEPNATGTIPVKIGWNLIGAYDKNLAKVNLSTTPNNIITSNYFGYNNGYISTDTLKVGKGYWVKANADGVINLNTTLAKGENKETINPINKDWGKITISDNAKNNTTLYLSTPGANLDYYELPPVPPTGIFDVRYNSDRMTEDISAEQEIVLNSAEYPVTIGVEGLDLIISDITGSLLNKTVKDGESIVITNNNINRLKIQGTITVLNYELSQNYPNPFNPNTKIKYTIPEIGNVKLTIYDQLGQKVTELVNEVQSAGRYEVNFNADKLSSGVYFYKIETGKFNNVKKMMILK